MPPDNDEDLSPNRGTSLSSSSRSPGSGRNKVNRRTRPESAISRSDLSSSGKSESAQELQGSPPPTEASSAAPDSKSLKKAALAAPKKPISAKPSATSAKIAAVSGKFAQAKTKKRPVDSASVEGDPGTNLELEVVSPNFEKGLPIAVKIAFVTALLLALACTVLGVVVSDITTKSVDQQINNSGINMLNILERSIDRFWEEPEDHDEKRYGPWEGTGEYKQRKQVVQRRLKKLVEEKGSSEELYNVIILTPKGDNFLVSALDAGGQIAERAPVSIASPVEHVTISQLTVNLSGKDVLVRKFEKDIGILQAQPADSAGLGGGEDEEDGASPDRDASVNEAGGQFKPTAKLNLLLSAEKINEVSRDLRFRIILAAIVTILMGVALTIAFASFFTAPIRYLVQDVEEVSGGNLEHKTQARSRDEIGLLAETFDVMTRNLKIAQQAEAKKKSIEHELNIAKEIQTKLLPERIPKIPGYAMHAYYQSAREVGGDYYDFIIIDEHHLGIIVADVSGKGIPASMVMTMTRSLIRLASHRNISAQDTLKKVNRILAKDIRRGMFVTAAYMVLDVRTRELKICSAGHNPLILYRADSKTVESIKPKGMALGFDKGPAFDKSLEEKDVKLNPGDCLISYTDGVVEAMNDKKEEFSEERFEQIVRDHAEKPQEEFVKSIVAGLAAFRGKAEQSDDITITTLSVLTPKQAAAEASKPGIPVDPDGNGF